MYVQQLREFRWLTKDLNPKPVLCTTALSMYAAHRGTPNLIAEVA